MPIGFSLVLIVTILILLASCMHVCANRQAVPSNCFLYRDAQLSSVLDNGAGTPAALAVLYMEVARRLGTPMVCHPRTSPSMLTLIAHVPNLITVLQMSLGSVYPPQANRLTQWLWFVGLHLAACAATDMLSACFSPRLLRQAHQLTITLCAGLMHSFIVDPGGQCHLSLCVQSTNCVHHV